MSMAHDDELEYWSELRRCFRFAASGDQDVFHAKFGEMFGRQHADYVDTTKVLDTYIKYGAEAAIRFCEIKLLLLREAGK